MKNEEVYKNFQERVNKFAEYCSSQCSCPCKFNNENCELKWLDDDVMSSIDFSIVPSKCHNRHTNNKTIELKNYHLNTEPVKLLKKFRKLFGYEYPIMDHFIGWYNKDIKSLVKSLNNECNWMCAPWDTACRELIGLAIHKLLLSGNTECETVGIQFTNKYINYYYNGHHDRNKTFRLIEDMSYIADTLEQYANVIDATLIVLDDFVMC